MARDSHDREDMLRDATGYRRRVELRIPHHNSSIFCGFREQGAFSLYWTPDDVFQFNATGELRRAFWRDRMLASYKRQLHWLNREDTGRVRLQRVALSEPEQIAVLGAIRLALANLAGSLNAGVYEVEGLHPADADVIQDLQNWLQTHDGPVQLAMHPGAGRK